VNERPPRDVATTHMMFALDTDDGALIALASHAEAQAHCKAVDVRDGYWLFFDDDGSPLEPRFEQPGQPEDSTLSVGAYTLQRAMSGRWLQERLGKVASVRGCGLASVEELVETLRINRGKRAALVSGRG
jgi:hypothetical protein